MVSGELDLLSDEVDWKDRGCVLFPSCLSCPLPRCIEEVSRGRQRLRMFARARRMAELSAAGKSTRDIARLFGISTRTVQRSLARSKLSRDSEGVHLGGRPKNLERQTLSRSNTMTGKTRMRSDSTGIKTCS